MVKVLLSRMSEGPDIVKTLFNHFNRLEDINIYLLELALPQSPLESLCVVATSFNEGSTNSATRFVRT